MKQLHSSHRTKVLNVFMLNSLEHSECQSAKKHLEILRDADNFSSLVTSTLSGNQILILNSACITVRIIQNAKLRKAHLEILYNSDNFSSLVTSTLSGNQIRSSKFWNPNKYPRRWTLEVCGLSDRARAIRPAIFITLWWLIIHRYRNPPPPF
jgi:hypothetical protein